ncbi:hypothetical protein GYMLUDRAFT_40863 [Collybiopsis luxurians FD-317 M1]|uniref:Uncharacterized protein n=1 Tax=Collybiopsis luxurians FD-317 M1 TaxID=944289 RepID=A0A0D0C6K6_9AGAR|nr:hypothetical protein GYMLUDRAFT_40863 [Collybiopsis luxurians FD-317 M1]
MILTREDINTPQVRPKKFSYVRNWRSGVGPADLTILVPPSPLFQSFDSPSSPVASIDLSRLCVTSIPPSECEVYQLSDPASSHERSAVVEIPAEFHEIYDADLGRTVTLEASEIVSPSSLPTLTFPEANKPQCLVPSGSSSSKFKPARLQSVSSTIRWLPTRIKYIILSQTTVRK